MDGPTSGHRLRRRPRVAAQIALFGAVGIVCVLAGLALWGIVLVCVAGPVFAVAKEPGEGPLLG